MSNSKTRILIADDSAFMRLIISDILEGDKELEVIAAVSNGLEAAQKTQELKPDVVVLDMNMGEYDGLFAVKKIMKESPTPIMILSAVGNKDLEPIFEALKQGAIDYMNKPSRNNSKMREVEDELIFKVKKIAKAKPKRISRTSLEPVSGHFSENRNYDVLVVGASTGGPTALEQLITALPADMNVPVLIAQHMPPNFIQPFVNRLNQLTQLEIMVGTRFMEPKPRTIIFAPGDQNMIVTRDASSGQIVIGFDEDDYDEYNHPSINSLMLSAAHVYAHRTIGVILTGMGKDGVRGLDSIRKKGGLTIAQDKASSVIYGMPKAAFETGAAQEVLDLKEIAKFIVNRL